MLFRKKDWYMKRGKQELSPTAIIANINRFEANIEALLPEGFKTDPAMDQIFPNIPHIKRNDHTSDIKNQTKEGVKKCVRIK